jgi:hypothetical protein
MPETRSTQGQGDSVSYGVAGSRTAKHDLVLLSLMMDGGETLEVIICGRKKHD